MRYIIKNTLKALTLMPVLAFSFPNNAPSPGAAVQYIRIGQCEQEYVVVVVTTARSTDAFLYQGEYTRQDFEKEYGNKSSVYKDYNLIINCT